MTEYDIIVVGSGPAGSAAATTAARAGLNVAIVDKATFPRDKLCGGLFTGRSQKAMRAIFGQEVTSDLFVTTDHMRFLSRGRVLADIPNAPPVHLTMRRDFDAMLHGEAVKAGAVPYVGQPITELGNSALTLRDGTQLGFRTLIGADGVNSFIARSLFGKPFDPDTIGFGLEIESPRKPECDGAVEIDFDAASWGYGWSFPKRETVTVGVGGINAKNADMKANMSAYVDQTNSDPDQRFKGQYLPFGDYKRKPGRDNILLAGDAAGLVDPITGEGIALAMESGQHAAEAAIKALKQNRPQTAYFHYEKLVKPIQRSIDQAKMWRMIMFPKATEGYFRKAFERGSSLQMKYLELLAGEAEYADLRGALLRRIPKLGWRLLKHRLGFRGPT
ncbi:geranylgeranyl reductase family protein [uncultured Litoreibacter sp.]|uniref:NAD(P)/FAD-dependent oxidoreductase n=1 Tax=uncultured Litoreibacter sp. TaxID=1392394 RepID=UPI002605ECF9|nr:geranylgeranyl reductase family protein [uncultured Litoreibacter sp.]